MEVKINWIYGLGYLAMFCLGIFAVVLGMRTGGLVICLLASNVILHEWVHIFSAQIANIDIEKAEIFGKSYVEFGLPADYENIPMPVLKKVQLVIMSGFFFDFVIWFFAIFMLWNSGIFSYAVIAGILAALFVMYHIKKDSDLMKGIEIEKLFSKV